MLKFVRLLAFVELIGGVLWLWPAVFPKRFTVEESVRQYMEGYRAPVDPPVVPPYPGIALIGVGTVSLAVTSRTSESR